MNSESKTNTMKFSTFIRNVNKYRKLNKYVQKLTTDERIALNSYLMSGAGELPTGSNLNVVLEYLVSKSLDEVKQIVVQATAYAENQEHSNETQQDIADNVLHRQINLSLNVSDSLDPTRLIILSRDINDAEKLTLQEVDVDSGDYIPVPVASMAQILRSYADAIEERQDELNREAGGF